MGLSCKGLLRLGNTCVKPQKALPDSLV